MSRHRVSRTRPRYGRMAAAGTSLLVTMVAVLGGIGLVPTSTPASLARPAAAESDDRAAGGGASLSRAAATTRARGQGQAPSRRLPPRSGQGRRVVFSETAQRVWLVGEDGAVRRTYLVSGSIYDNLHPGTYRVYSRSERAWGIDDSGTMRWFVRFTQGPNAAIGFHSIPMLHGEPVQTAAQLGTPLSHGCIRQRLGDAKALWDFAPVGTTVVVV